MISALDFLIKAIYNCSMDIVIIGGGAAGFFAAIAAKEANPTANVKILEKTAQLLVKVRISGGGRCNVTHACFDPMQLSKNYIRGNKELIGPFTRFGPKNTIEWFESRGVSLKVEDDGRMFPESNTSQSIIDCLQNEANRLGIEIFTKHPIDSIKKVNNQFHISDLICDSVILTTGSSPQGHALAQSLGHTIQPPVPSLFTFNVPDSPLTELAGICVQDATISLLEFKETGPLLITHWGFSGPPVLRLSAWCARLLHEKKYNAKITIDWVTKMTHEQLLADLLKCPPGQHLSNHPLWGVPKNLWKKLIANEKRTGELGKKEFQKIVQKLKSDSYEVSGKTTFKEEFVTCGGVTRSEIDFKTMQSKICPGLFFAGEVIDIDAITGGFNFQNAWTTGWLAGNNVL